MNTRQDSPVDRVVSEVSTWSGIETGEGRFGSATFLLGEREIGHVHGGGQVDIGFAKPLHDQLLEDGLTGSHYVLPESNATTFRVRSDDEVDRAVALLRLSYLYRVNTLQQGGKADEGVADLDLVAEVRGLAVSEGVCEVFLSMTVERNS